uniref:Uncharacterized protein n=1 Tax=Oryza meridionalis TaxID=40149 RepID=A0A0E0E3K2_9ORYZ
MADAAMLRYLGRINQQRGGNNRGAVAIARRRRLLILDSGRALMLIGALVLTRRLTMNTTSAAATGLLVAFLLWLLGVALAMLAVVVARQTALPWARAFASERRRRDGAP